MLSVMTNVICGYVNADLLRAVSEKLIAEWFPAVDLTPTNVYNGHHLARMYRVFIMQRVNSAVVEWSHWKANGFNFPPPVYRRDHVIGGEIAMTAAIEAQMVLFAAHASSA
jgi:hypothetical protein